MEDDIMPNSLEIHFITLCDVVNFLISHNYYQNDDTGSWENIDGDTPVITIKDGKFSVILS